MSIIKQYFMNIRLYLIFLIGLALTSIFGCSDNNQTQNAYSDNVKWLNNFSFSKPYENLLGTTRTTQGAVISLELDHSTNEIHIYGIIASPKMKVLIQDIKKFKQDNKLSSKVKIKFFRKCLIKNLNIGEQEYGGLSSKDLLETVLIL